MYQHVLATDAPGWVYKDQFSNFWMTIIYTALREKNALQFAFVVMDQIIVRKTKWVFSGATVGII